MKKSSTPAAINNVELAMDLVQQAQNLLDRAAQKLSPIRHGSDLMDKTFAVREKAHKLWYQLDRAAHGNHLGFERKGMSLDTEPEVSAGTSHLRSNPVGEDPREFEG